MAASAEYAPPKELVSVRVQSSGKLEGAASLLEMLEDKADNRRITASELAAVRCIVETCAANLDGALTNAPQANTASSSRTPTTWTRRW